MGDLIPPNESTKKIAPWLEPIWDGMNLAKFPNTILIHGQSGIGKFEFSIELAKALLCEESFGAKPCNHCEACRWFDSANHPDFIALVPETHRKLLPHSDFDSDSDSPKKSKLSQADSDGDVAEKKEKKSISIEDARSAIESLSIGSHRGGNRIILVYPLEMLRSDSANTLLKSLEEPPKNTIFILLADRLDRVLPTIRSRCRLLSAPRPDRLSGLNWLRTQLSMIPGLKMSDTDIESIYDEQGGAPYAVFDSIVARHNKDELTIAIQASRYLLQSMSQGHRTNWLDAADKTQKARYSFLLATMQRWVSDLQSCAQMGSPRYYPKHEITIQMLAQQARLPKLLRLWKSLIQARRHENHPLATRIQLEALLSQYQQVFED
ncbi:DNA polymerase III subunit delta' [Polynucleobacter sp. UK-Mo-2m-Kol15]|uniref:DNA polymerase III subunit delta' n=1 Tax=Polynucleobacter sp. UK-Mo-2m-Kol15 TaxID=2576916 RepID=UPI001C0A9756|nr:DNA polymerase III subunit delta' [Polynucleobacter sp. UK-Mo-2m-Kol15]MBU3575590.1 DNA polymerase III subunit delta' [Polynucleobacter sp. UK-Mo-2m-Kol15]